MLSPVAAAYRNRHSIAGSKYKMKQQNRRSSAFKKQRRSKSRGRREPSLQMECLVAVCADIRKSMSVSATNVGVYPDKIQYDYTSNLKASAEALSDMIDNHTKVHRVIVAKAAGGDRNWVAIYHTSLRFLSNLSERYTEISNLFSPSNHTLAQLATDIADMGLTLLELDEEKTKQEEISDHELYLNESDGTIIYGSGDETSDHTMTSSDREFLDMFLQAPSTASAQDNTQFIQWDDWDRVFRVFISQGNI